MMLAREKKRHQQGYGPFACDRLSKGRSMKKRGDQTRRRLTVDPLSSLGRLMYAMPSVSLMGAGLKSAIEGSGVVMRKEEMYFVSAISSCSRIMSRSSMSRARRRVSLGQPLVSYNTWARKHT
jgi:hypothetical protein